MSTLENLISETNKQLLWEVLIGELKIANISQQTLSNIRVVFDKNLSIFRNKSSPTDQLIHLNKQFLKIMVIAVNKLFPNLKQERRIKKINITDEQVIIDNNYINNSNTNTNIELYKAEDIQQSRQSQLENLYNKKKEDFEHYTQVNKPQELDFSDHINDEKIISMDSLLANAMAQRNEDLQTIDNTYFNSHNNINTNTWLQAEETSSRLNQNNIETQNINNKRLKHINFDDENNISLVTNEATNNKKKVSWNNDDKSSDISNIFSKLKKVEEKEKQTVYEVQASNPLPRNTSPISIPINPLVVENTNIVSPILTNSQIVKQLNEMNAKLDKLFSLVETLLETKKM
jgi:hypothetical protein